MASRVQICNLALTRLGANRITSLTDNTTEGKLCNTLLDDMIEQVMIEGPWSTVIRRQALAQTSNTPVFGYNNEFQLPTDPFCLRVLSINDDVPGEYDFAIEGDKLKIDISAVSIKYIGLITDSQQFGPALTRAIVSRMAAELSIPITGDADLGSKMFGLYERHVEEGLATDGQQGSGDQTTSPNLHLVRPK